MLVLFTITFCMRPGLVSVRWCITGHWPSGRLTPLTREQNGKFTSDISLIRENKQEILSENTCQLLLLLLLPCHRKDTSPLTIEHIQLHFNRTHPIPYYRAHSTLPVITHKLLITNPHHRTETGLLSQNRCKPNTEHNTKTSLLSYTSSSLHKRQKSPVIIEHTQARPYQDTCLQSSWNTVT